MDEDRKFDEVIQSSLPFILFASDFFSRELIRNIQSLYDFYKQKRIPAFNDGYEKIVKLINEREKFTDKNEMRIASFIGKTQRIDNRIDDIEIKFKILGMEKNLNQIGKNKTNLLSHGKTLHKLSNRIKKLEGTILVKQKEVIGEKEKSKSVDSTEKTCPQCKYVWQFTGRGHRIKDYVRIQCPKCKQFFKEKVIE